MAAYLIKLILCSGIFYLYYLLFLRDKKFHHYNRFYLLFATGLSFLIPLINIDFFIQNDNERIGKLLELVYANQQAEQIVLIGAGEAQSVSWPTIIYILSALISAALLLLVAIRIIRIMRLKKNYAVQSIGDVAFVATDLQEAPFSFFRNLFWRKDISLQEEAGQQIFRHEMAHIEQKHSWDRTFMQIVKAVCWFNPVFYFIEKELVLIHEYIADEKAIANKDGRAFAAMLLRSRIDHFGYSPGQAIFYSSIKKRLQMLTNHQKTKYSYARRLLVLPLLGCITFALGINIQKAEAKETIKVLEAQLATEIATSVQDTLPPLKGKVEGVVITKEEYKPSEELWQKAFAAKNAEVYLDGENQPATFNVKVMRDSIANFRFVEAKNGKNAQIWIISKKANEERKIKLRSANKDSLPLFVINGEVLPKGTDIGFLDPNEIEAISVLKDHPLMQTYGEDGKNGVLLITTKQGRGIKENKKDDTINKQKEQYDKEFTTVEEPATYHGDWQVFLRANLNADIPVENGAPPGKYKVTVSFRVDKEGNISEIRALNNPGYGTAAEAIKVVNNSGTWNAAKQRGEKVISTKKIDIVWQVQE